MSAPAAGRPRSASSSHGLTLGVLGFGRLGRRVAAVARAFEMDVIAWSQNLQPDDARDGGAEPVSFDELLERSDVLSVHTRLSDRTRGLIGARRARADEAVRGARQHLARPDRRRGRAGRRAARRHDRAAPRSTSSTASRCAPDHPLRRAPNALVTPHIGYVTTANYELFYGDAVEDIAAFAAGAPVRVLNER